MNKTQKDSNMLYAICSMLEPETDWGKTGEHFWQPIS